MAPRGQHQKYYVSRQLSKDVAWDVSDSCEHPVATTARGRGEVAELAARSFSCSCLAICSELVWRRGHAGREHPPTLHNGMCEGRQGPDRDGVLQPHVWPCHSTWAHMMLYAWWWGRQKLRSLYYHHHYYYYTWRV